MARAGLLLIQRVVFSDTLFSTTFLPLFPSVANSAGEVEYELPPSLVALAFTAVRCSIPYLSLSIEPLIYTLAY
jgi:hypothetical protein